MKWTSVKDGLPLEKKTVLVYDRWAGEFREDTLILRDGPELSWEWARLKIDVTHWAPLPRIPKVPHKPRISDDGVEEC